MNSQACENREIRRKQHTLAALKTIRKDIMKNKTTYYHLIIDKSGSMSEHIEQTFEGVN